MFLATFDMRSEKGPVREKNEDSLGALQPPNTPPGVDGVYVVADGLGGHHSGEVASAMAVELVIKEYRTGGSGGVPAPGNDPAAHLSQLLRRVSQVIWSVGVTGESMHRDPDRPGMATTATVALVMGRSLVLGHVGDTRAYLLRGTHLTRLTEDHTLVAEQVRRGVLTAEEAKGRPSNVLTQAVGLEQPIAPFTHTTEIQEGDRLLLCSDGLHGFLEDSAIAAAVGREQIPGTADFLIALALAAGTDDNITALVVGFGSQAAPP